MKIWLIKIGETLPVDGNVRLHRYGILAPLLASRGHEVTWWASTFYHQKKSYRFPHAKTVEIAPRYTLELLHAPGYGKNISFSRLRFNRILRKGFRKRLEKEAPPDIILCSFPIGELASAAVDFAKRHDIPIVIDARDEWPDIFLDVFPGPLRGVFRLLFQPLFAANRRLFREATCLVGVSLRQLNWALAYAARERRPSDRVFYLGYDRPELDAALLDGARVFWRGEGIDGKKFNCVYLGNITSNPAHVDLDTVMAGVEAHFRCADNRDISFIFCGLGTHLERYRARFQNIPEVIFPGWIDAPEISVLLELADVGLCPYGLQASSMSLPLKPFEYFSRGVPVLSSIQGELKGILQDGPCGLSYRPGDFGDFLRNLYQLYDSADERACMAAHALEGFEEHFAAQKVYAEMCEYLEEIHRGGFSDESPRQEED